MNTIIERKKHIEQNNELSLAVEGKGTNLRIWQGRKDGNVYMRLDKFQEYSSPLNEESATYLESDKKEVETVKKLANLFGFKSDINNLSQILEMTKEFKYRQLKNW